MKRTATKPSAKISAQKHTLNPAVRRAVGSGSPFNQQDPKRRLGNFQAAGEHSRQGGRRSGIVGQRKRKYRAEE
ncbi:MAG TPA: hypothetical protein VMF30_16920 [Pirellulales bacterium]|nr:hypothetical protein [Pirellulales bacterium]